MAKDQAIITNIGTQQRVIEFIVLQICQLKLPKEKSVESISKPSPEICSNTTQKAAITRSESK